MISYSDTGLTISETLQTNAIVWLYSLPEQEMGPTRRILEDLEGLAGLQGLGAAMLSPRLSGLPGKVDRFVGGLRQVLYRLLVIAGLGDNLPQPVDQAAARGEVRDLTCKVPCADHRYAGPRECGKETRPAAFGHVWIVAEIGP